MPCDCHILSTVEDDADEFAIQVTPETDSKDRALIYQWDNQRWSWLTDRAFVHAQIVPYGMQATRLMPDAGLMGPHTTKHFPNNSVKFIFSITNKKRSNLKKGQRIFIQHFENMQSWGVHGRNVTELMSVINISIHSTSGMGFRCDLCKGDYVLRGSDVSIKPGTARPMSITADAVHFMHHAGTVSVENCSFQGQGDDGLNIHGNFIVLNKIIKNGSLSLGTNNSFSKVQYIDETGPGWITSAPTYFVGDTVEFFSRQNLKNLTYPGRHQYRAKIVSATDKFVTFDKPLPPGLKRFDMFISVTRISRLRLVDTFFGNSNARGAVISAVNSTISDCTFANLSLSAITIFEGGCGAQPNIPDCPWCGDYTEGPLAHGITIRKNRFLACASDPATGVGSRGMIQIAGCHPKGQCGTFGDDLLDPLSPELHVYSNGFVLRLENFTVAGGNVFVSAMKYLDVACQMENRSVCTKELAGVKMGVYVRNTALDVFNGSKFIRVAYIDPLKNPWSRAGLWMQANLTSGIELKNGTEFFIAHWFPATNNGHEQKWIAGKTLGSRLEMKYGNSVSDDLPLVIDLPEEMGTISNQWTRHGDSGLSSALEWNPIDGWCDPGGTLPAPVVSKPDDHGKGRITETGVLLDDGSQVFVNIRISENHFVSPTQQLGQEIGKDMVYQWKNSFIHVGAVDGLHINDNRMVRHFNDINAPDLVLYSNSDSILTTNTCLSGANTRDCVISAHPTL